MVQEKSHHRIGKWVLGSFFVMGFMLIFAGDLFHTEDRSSALVRTFVYAGAALAVTGIVAHVLG